MSDIKIEDKITKSKEYKNIMAVGLCCIDDLYEVSNYPIEDTDQR